MRLDVVSLTPEAFAPLQGLGVIGRAFAAGRAELHVHNPRDFATDRHRTVDDRPYGGGPGMLMKVAPLRAALGAATAPRHVVYLSPQGAPLDQAGLRRLGRCEHLVLLCGRYEGVDERLVATEVDEELSLGDFVLSGGELAAMAVIDGIVRLLPGALGHAQSAHEDSFSAGLLDCPHYTRPESLGGLEVPAVLLSGDHERIRRWRLKQSLGRTWQRRPELLQRLALGDEERALLAEFIRELADDDGAGRSSSRSSAS